MAVVLSSQMPHDVDIDEMHRSDDERISRMFDELSWQTFVALIWPVDARRELAPSLSVPLETRTAVPRWRTFRNVKELAPPHGLAPLPWASGRDQRGVPERNVHVSVPPFRYLPSRTQADGGVLWDQSGQPVLYETLIDRVLFGYVSSHELYNLEGQAAFDGKPVYMPPGLHWDKHPDGTSQRKELNPDRAGAVALKLAWKILDDTDDPGRFYGTPFPSRPLTASS